MKNARTQKLRIDNSTGETGIIIAESGNFVVRVNLNGKQINLGTYTNIKDAVTARNAGNKLIVLYS